MTDRLPQTPTQTVGPYFAYGLTPAQYGYDWSSLSGPVLVEPATPGTHIVIEGEVLDGAGTPVTDALIEIRQADHAGRYSAPGAHSAFRGFGRCGTGTLPDGLFRFETIKPGPPAAGEAPHIHVIVQMRGLLTHLFTRLYFEDEPANATDPVLALVPPERRATLIARLTEPGRYRFDMRMQGDTETVFFDL
jgi:protocatechuate 3,4-dioxygenase alpha subunit